MNAAFSGYQVTRMIRTFKHLSLENSSGSPPMCTLTYRLPAWAELLGFAIGSSDPASKVRGMCSKWQERLHASVLNEHRRNHYKHNNPPIRLCPVYVAKKKTLPCLHSFYPRFFFTIANIANHDQINLYISQVTGDHPTFTCLSMAKHLLGPD
jgi:hypothetical protein